MDRTTWELGSRVYNILAVGICFDGISLPIYFETYDKDGATSFVEHTEFMEHVLDIVPDERIRCLVADREFGNGNFIKMADCQRNSVLYAIERKLIYPQGW